MSNPSKLGAIPYEAETNFGEDVTTFATFRLPVIGSVDCSGLNHNKIAPDRVVQYRQDGTQWILGIQSGSFKTKLYLTGHGSSTTGTVTATATETLLGRVFGNIAVGGSGTTFTGGTATVPTTTSSATLTPGQLIRGGLINDARANGQFAEVATHITTNLTLNTGFDAAPANADILYGATTIYPSENPITGVSVGSNRFLLQNANVQYECHGCFPSAVAFAGLNTGEVPTIEITWTVAWWRYSITTFPTVVATETFQPAANAGGSLFVAPIGTATRAKRTFRNFTLTYKFGIVPLMGPGGASAFQSIVGARRTMDDIDVTWTEDADAATTTPFLPGLGTATVDQHLLYTLGPTATKAMAIRLQRLCVTNVAIQKNDGGINRLTISAKAYTGTTTTSDLTLAAFKMGLS